MPEHLALNSFCNDPDPKNRTATLEDLKSNSLEQLNQFKLEAFL